MKTTGIVKKVGKSGQVKIPKNLRETLHISAGDPLEIYTDIDKIIFKKFSPIGELAGIAKKYADSLNQICQMKVIVTDRDTVIACEGVSKRDYLDWYKRLTEEFDFNCVKREELYRYNGEKIYAYDDVKEYIKYAMPIICEGDIVGCVACVTEEENAITDRNSTEAIMIKTTAKSIALSFEG